MSFLRDAAKWYQGESHQDRAWDDLESQLPSFLIDTFKKAYRKTPAPEPKPLPTSGELGWDEISLLAKQCGAKFPECVAAQWALESGFGQFTSGKITTLVSKVRVLPRQLGRTMAMALSLSKLHSRTLILHSIASTTWSLAGIKTTTDI